MRSVLCGALAAAFLLSAVAPSPAAKKREPSPTPTPSAAPTRSAGAAKSSLPPPAVMVFPLTVNGDASKEAGARIALLFATQFAQSGGLTVKAPPPAIERKDYLEAARSAGADYYIAGYITPIGNEVALVEQVVSTYSGIVVWSNTAQVLTYADAASQADLMRTALLRHAGRAIAQEDAPIAQPSHSPSPQPQSSGVSIGLGGLFSRKPKGPSPSPAPAGSGGVTVTAPPNSAPRAVAAATRPPAAAPTPRPAAPVASTQTSVPATAPALASAAGAAPAIDLLRVVGSAAAGARTYTESALTRAFGSAGYRVAVDPTNTLPETTGRFKRVCDRTSSSAIASATVSYDGRTAVVEMTIYNCSGDILYKGRAAEDNRDQDRAIDQASAALAADYQRPVRKRRLTA